MPVDSQVSIDTAKSTFMALTTAMRPRTLVDNIFQRRPVWNKLRQNMKPVSGTCWQPAIELRELTGQTYTRGTNLNLYGSFSPEIATTAVFETTEYLMPVMIPTQDVLNQGSQGLVDLHRKYMENAVRSVRKDLSTQLFTTRSTLGNIGTGQVSNGMLSLDQCHWYGNTYGGVDPTVENQETWEAHCMYGQADGASKIRAVAPSLQNFEYIIEQTEMTTDEKPDLIVVSEGTWLALKAQVPAQEYATQRAAYANTDIVKWGYSALWVLDVPIVRDRDVYDTPFVADQTTVKEACGHDAFGINFNHFKYIYNKAASFQWHEDGWRREILSYDCIHNQYFVWGSTACDSRRTQFRMVNIDPTMDIEDFELGTVRLPGADAQ